MTRFRNPRLLWSVLGALALLYSIAIAGRAIVLPASSTAWTAYPGSFGLVSAGSADSWYNYDFNGSQPTASNVDWPVRYLFAVSANINKIKYAVDGCPANGGPTLSPCLDQNGGTKWFVGYENGAPYQPEPYDTDQGIKDGLNCALDQHMRVYANPCFDWNYDPELGFYILGSVHKDREGTGCLSKFYSAEGEQGWWDSRMTTGLPNWTVHANISYWQNYEPQRWADSSHWVHSDGYTTYVDVP